VLLQAVTILQVVSSLSNNLVFNFLILYHIKMDLLASPIFLQRIRKHLQTVINHNTLETVTRYKEAILSLDQDIMVDTHKMHMLVSMDSNYRNNLYSNKFGILLKMIGPDNPAKSRKLQTKSLQENQALNHIIAINHNNL